MCCIFAHTLSLFRLSKCKFELTSSQVGFLANVDKLSIPCGISPVIYLVDNFSSKLKIEPIHVNTDL